MADSRERVGVIHLTPSDDAELRQLWRRVKKREKRQGRGASGVPPEDKGREQSVFNASQPAVLR